jgi:hypothetical protein
VGAGGLGERVGAADPTESPPSLIQVNRSPVRHTSSSRLAM